MNQATILLYSCCCVARLYGNNAIQLLRFLSDSSITDKRMATQRCSTGDSAGGIKKDKSFFLPFILVLLLSQAGFTQTRLSFPAVYDIALQNNLQLRAADLQISGSRTMSRSWNEIPKTGIFAENEDQRPSDPKGILKIGVSQSLEWPGVYKARKNLLQQQVTSFEVARSIRALEIKRDVQSVYYNLWYLQSRQALWQRLDSIYTSLAQAAFLRVRTGESAGLDSIAASAKSQEVSVQVRQLVRDIQSGQELLKRYVGTSAAYLPEQSALQKIVVSFTDTSFTSHPQLQYQQQAVAVAGSEIAVQQQNRKPHFSGRFFTQRLYGMSDPFSGFSVSVGLPIFGGSSYSNKIKAAEIERNYQQSLYDYKRLTLTTAFAQAYQQLQKDEELLRYYEGTGLAQAEAIMKAANIAYRAGEIGFADLTQFLTQSIDIQKNYLDVLNQYNQSAIQLNYYLNK